ncbi:TIGR03620 family F420-dependent LLM class oxidoreductase [Frankia sp. AgPm24]|uniref:TIGR03620 family F420-dependent LLM class oxidoreductase n=1 Tax=Frankia sp. AgPm24 TaxID=631128 RepID=UPI00200CFDC3|nr:TIGR03620 family F420-dependent LLM class oxidoreductase [Frankia sp. AgPm24]MCK9923749.1 TIGR03620 family F420-dependent LLM class oxidoreductase [Frankia sp. AgPm24]
MSPAALPGPVGLWGGFLDRLPAAQAVEAVREVEAAGVASLWLPEHSGVDPFVRAALYLSATTHLTVALGVATIYARDPEAMVAVSSTLEEAFPGRFILGLGVSHRSMVEARGHTFGPPLATMRAYLAAMDAAAGQRRRPPTVLGALGPKMMTLAGTAADGAHTYFAPVPHTAAIRAALGPGRFLAPAQMVALTDADGAVDQDAVRQYLRFCLSLPNYTANLARYGFTDEDFAAVSDPLVDALVVADDPDLLGERVSAHLKAGADQVVLQFVPPPHADVIRGRLVARELATVTPS